MSWRDIKGKRVYTTDSHHYVLRAWAEVADEPLTLLSFDSHTDTQPAFRRAARNGHDPQQLFANTNWRDLAQVDNAIPRLWHDEHIDCALKAGYLNRAIIVLAVPTPGTTTGVGELILSDKDERTLNDELLSDLTRVPVLSSPFILDIDLDAFRSLRPLQRAGERFAQLVRDARCITVAREAACVASLRFEDDLVSADLEKALYLCIEAALGK